jgi:hypothetical protein
MLRLPVAAALLLASAAMTRADDPTHLHLWEQGAPGFEDRKDEWPPRLPYRHVYPLVRESRLPQGHVRARTDPY